MRNASLGFTLAELLIALGILGVIATFAIPKILVAQQDTKRKAVLKETMAALQNMIWEGVQTDHIPCSGGGL
jgi:prepilin-type N-terminal cleavage/methylation domain-containing protein